MYAVIYVNNKTSEILKKYNPAFLDSAMRYFFDKNKNKKEIEVCVKLNRKAQYNFKKVGKVDEDLYKQLKNLARDNKVSLTSIITYIIEDYNDFIEK
jgi:hypothetical protein